jgi:hypothetical protein
VVDLFKNNLNFLGIKKEKKWFIGCGGYTLGCGGYILGCRGYTHFSVNIGIALALAFAWGWQYFSNKPSALCTMKIEGIICLEEYLKFRIASD